MEGGPYISVLKKQFGTGDYRKAPTAELIIFIITSYKEFLRLSFTRYSDSFFMYDYILYILFDI